MEFRTKQLEDGRLEFTIMMTLDEAEQHVAESKKVGDLPTLSGGLFGKVPYCIKCSDNKFYQIESPGDIAANIEAAATCARHAGSPNYGLTQGHCP